MWLAKFWTLRYWALRYWPKVGASYPGPNVVDELVLVLNRTENVRLYDGLRKDNQVIVTITENVRVRR